MVSLYVINSRGDKELFSLQKVCRSARWAGASQELSRKIAKVIEKEAYPGIRTSEIFQKVKKLLHQKTPGAALRFNLKEGMRKLGPTGFPFEKFIGGIFRKLHSKDALANHARFLDILNGPFFKTKKYKDFKIKTILVTNTKFTNRAKNYSNCVGVETLGWKIPRNKGLEYLIEKEKLYPVTILPSLNKYLRDVFVSEKIMLVEDVLKVDPQKFSKRFKISVKYLYPLIKEAKTLLEK